MVDPLPDDSESRFEKELRTFAPVMPPASMRAAVAAGIDYRPEPGEDAVRRGDRVLRWFLTSGAVAAALIITFHTMDYLDVRRRPPATPAPAIVRQTTVQYLAAL